MIRKTSFFLLVLIFCSSCGKHIDYIQSFYYNEKFRYYLNEKALDKAQKAELQSKENLQDRFELDSNLGIIFNLQNKNAEAEKSFDEALKNGKENFAIRFNRGVYFQTQNKIDEALAEYQAALDLNPASLETKTNIELLIQKQKDHQKQQGQGQSQDQQPKDQKQDNKDGQSGDQKDDKQNDKENENQENKQNKDRKQSPKYQPRPFQGEQLSEGDVKKILGELSQQDKKIRAQFDKKEKEETGVEKRNEKDW